MDLLPAYRSLISSPEQLAACREAIGIGPLLRTISSLWGLDTIGDGELISQLNQCHGHVLDIDLRQLEGVWLPHRYDAATRSLSWCLPEGHPTQPFLDQYLQQCLTRSALNCLVRPRTSITPLLSAPVVDGPAHAAGFIFHLSRCGSTLVSGCLAERDDTCVLSESPLLTDVLLDASLTDGQKRHLLPQLVRLQAAPFPGRDRVIVKWNAWDLCAWPLIRSAFPDVPSVALFRDPEEILASHGRSAGRHMSGDPTLGHVDPVFAAGRGTVLERRIRVLRGLTDAMSQLVAEPGTMPVDYRQLDLQRIGQIGRHFALAPDADADARMQQRLGFHSKEPERTFAADGVQKKQWFDADDRHCIHRELMPGHRRLVEAAGT